jgi:hypothetical protein
VDGVETTPEGELLSDPPHAASISVAAAMAVIEYLNSFMTYLVADGQPGSVRHRIGPGARKDGRRSMSTTDSPLGCLRIIQSSSAEWHLHLKNKCG